MSRFDSAVFPDPRRMRIDPIVMPAVGVILSLFIGAVDLQAEDSPWSGTATGTTGWVFPSAIRDHAGHIGSDELLAETRLFWRPHRAVRVGLGLAASRDGFDRDGTDPALDLPDHVQHGWMRVPVAVMFSPHWGISLQGSLGTGTDGEASMQAGRQYQIQAGPLFIRDDNLIVSVLVNVSSRIDEDPSVFPVVSLYWRIAPEWRLTVIDEVDNVSRLTWAMREELDLGLRVDVRLREAALAGDQVLVDDRVSVAFEAAWHPLGRERLDVIPFIGTMLARRLAMRDAQGDERWSIITRPALMLGLDLRASF
jgi:hypothetical protein